MSFKIAHLTDLHIGPVPEVPFWRYLNKRLSGYYSWHFKRRYMHKPDVLSAHIEQLKDLRPDHIVVTGDIVNLGMPEEFEQSLTWLKALDAIAPLNLVPGNHDAYLADSPVHWQLWDRWMGDKIVGRDQQFPYAIKLGEVAIIGLSSAVPSPWGRAWGKIGTLQLALLEQLLAKQASDWIILLIHHPIFEGASPPRKSLLDAVDLRAVLSRQRVDLVLSGHEHKAQQATIPTQAGTLQAITAPSASITAASPVRTGGFNVIELDLERPAKDSGTVHIDHWLFDQGRGKPVLSRRRSLSFDRTYRQARALSKGGP